MGVVSGCGEQEVGVASGSGWNIWVWLLSVVVRRYIDFLILLSLLLLYLFFFAATFCSFLKMFFKFKNSFLVGAKMPLSLLAMYIENRNSRQPCNIHVSGSTGHGRQYRCGAGRERNQKCPYMYVSEVHVHVHIQIIHRVK